MAPTPTWQRRLTRELKTFATNHLEGIRLLESDDLFLWKLLIEGPPGTLYAGEQFTLQFRFPADYPMTSPQVTFVGTAPIHPHIYTNGHICLNILYDHWTPALTVESVCVSIQSMLASATEKRSPVDNDIHIWRNQQNPKDTPWRFYNDAV
ncbi:hypothetical protein IWQ62_002287 [Dispira parvispora]|uniref:UBC core domain-containing protein n=1 Tax=Dispira parvispora TaxID=1520584 RepID=A0A9W8AQB7_9FUNG|nr:hypothetical protein IWQ62_002287 [Dispira parvispora]